MTIRMFPLFMMISALSIAAGPARAQLAVIDVPAVAQLIQEVQTMEQEVRRRRISWRRPGRPCKP